MAAHLGKSLRETQECVDSREFSEWKAYYELEPFGEERGDFRIAQLCCLVASLFRSKGQKAFTPSDFMPQFDSEKAGGKGQTADQMKAMLMQVTDAYEKSGGKKTTYTDGRRLTDGSDINS